MSIRLRILVEPEQPSPDTEHESLPEETHLPSPTLWPIGFAIGIVVLLVGLIINPLLISSIGAAIAIVFAILWAREATAELRGEPVVVEPERRELTDAAGRPARRSRSQRCRTNAVTRSVFLEGATLGLGAAIGGLDHAARRRLRGPAGVPRPDAAQGRPRPDRRSSRSASGTSPPSSSTPPRERSVAADGLHPQQRQRRRPRDEAAGAELHDHLEPLRPPRLPGAGERPERTEVHSARRPSRAHAERPGRVRVRSSPPATAARATAASTTPRATASPARPCARSTATTFEINNGRLDPPQHVLGLEGRRHRARRPRSTSTRRSARASTSTAPSSCSIPSSRRTTRR